MVQQQRRGRRLGRGIRIALLLAAIAFILYWFWWQPSREPTPPLRIEFRP